MIIKECLENSLVSSTVLNIICLHLFKAGYYNWEPETISMELKEISESIPAINFDKIQAISTLITTEQYYQFYEPFKCLTNVFNMDDPYFMVETPLDGIDICWSIMEAKLNDPENFDNPPVFSKEVEGYVETCFKYSGIIKTPDMIKPYILSNYDKSKDCNEEQIAINLEYEKEINQYILSRVKKIKSDISSLNLDISDKITVSTL